MNPPSAPRARRGIIQLYHHALEKVVCGLAIVAGASLMLIVFVVCGEVVFRRFGISLTGGYDVVQIAAAVSVAAALPYTTAIKGHVAIEFFFHKLGARGRSVVDALMRLLGIGLFGLLACGCVEYGNSLRANGEVSMTSRLPVFWVPYVLAGACVLVVLVKIYHLTHAGRSMLKP